MLGARIPPELFSSILFFLNALCASQRLEEEDSATLRRDSASSSSNDTLAPLKRCSLVSRFWANKSRRYIFLGKTLKIRCRDDAEIFRRYTVHGCYRLIPVHKLIRDIEVVQGYDERNSFLHLMHHPLIEDKLRDLEISGPTPKGFHPSLFSAPYWGVPPSVYPLPIWLKNRIRLQDIHFPSFAHVSRYMRHFARASKIDLGGLTWPSDDWRSHYGGSKAPTPFDLPTPPPQRKSRFTMRVSAWNCTDPIHLAVSVIMLNRWCPLHRLSEDHLGWMLMFMRLLWGEESLDSHVYISEWL